MGAWMLSRSLDDQFRYGMGVLDSLDEFRGDALGDAHFTEIEEGVEDGTHHHVGADRVVGRFAVASVGLADDLPHGESATREGEGAKLRPVVATTPFVDGRGAAEIARQDEEHLIGQAAVLEVLEKSGNRLVHGPAQHVHALYHTWIVAVGMHVPASAVNGHETSP